VAIQYSFKQHFLQYIIKQSATLFPGVDFVIGMYYNKAISGVEVLANSDDFNRKKDQNFDEWHSLLAKYRSQRPRYSWINLHPPKLENASSQLLIQSEYDHHTLLLRFPNSYDGLQDILLITFKNEEHIFRMGKDSQRLSTELKQSIASVYVRMLDSIKKQMEDDHEIYTIIQEHGQSSKQLNESELQIQERWKLKHLNLVESIVSSKSKEMDLPEDLMISFNDEALSYLADHYDNIKELEESIRNSLIIALNESDLDTKRLKIEKWHIVIKKAKTSKEKEAKIDTRFNRTITLLDRYENAASLLINKRLNITGSNLGEHLNPPISAAAISDAIRKHGSKITLLLNKFPQRWSILRRNFKPIQNKLYNAQHELDQRAS